MEGAIWSVRGIHISYTFPIQWEINRTQLFFCGFPMVDDAIDMCLFPHNHDFPVVSPSFKLKPSYFLLLDILTFSFFHGDITPLVMTNS